MLARKCYTIGLCFVLIGTLIAVPPRSTRAADVRGEQAPIRLYATASAGPIGSLCKNWGTGAVTINGRRAADQESIWSGDLLQTETEARVILDSVGDVRFSRGTMARLSVTRDKAGENDNGWVLIASLTTGELQVKLLKDAAAYIETLDTSFTTTAGAAFRANIRDGHGVVNAGEGNVSVEKPSRQDRALTIAPVDHRNTLQVTTRHSISIRVQVMEDQKPVADVPVVFAVNADGLGVGRLGIGTVSADTLTTATDASGIARIPFEAGTKPGRAKIAATIQGTRVSWIGEVEVKGATWNSTNIGILFGILGAGAVGGGIALAKAGGKKSIQIQPPQVQNP